MKIAPYKIDSFINSLKDNKEIFGALIYGPEPGLVSINTTKIANLIVPNASDPFLISNISPQKIEEDGAIVIDEFVSISMMGGRKLIRIDGAGNKITGSLKPIFGNDKKAKEFSKPVGDNFILINAGPLDASSSLRKFADANPHFASIACYEDNEATIKNIIREKLKEKELQAEPRAIDIIVEKFGKNRLIVLNELEKLSLYMGNEKFITADIAGHVIADISEISTNEFVNSFFDLNLGISSSSLEKLFNEKINAIAIIRFLSNYLLKLYSTQENILQGSTVDKEIKSQRIFFKQEHIFKKHLRIWDIKSIKTLLKKLQELEVKCKSSGNDAQLLLKSFNNFCFLRYKSKLRNI